MLVRVGFTAFFHHRHRPLGSSALQNPLFNSVTYTENQVTLSVFVSPFLNMYMYQNSYQL